MTCRELVKIIGIEYKLISEYLNEMGLQPVLSKRYTPSIVSHAAKSNCQILNAGLMQVAEIHGEKLKGLKRHDNCDYFLTYAVVDAMLDHEFYSKENILKKVNKLKASLL